MEPKLLFGVCVWIDLALEHADTHKHHGILAQTHTSITAYWRRHTHASRHTDADTHKHHGILAQTLCTPIRSVILSYTIYPNPQCYPHYSPNYNVEKRVTKTFAAESAIPQINGKPQNHKSIVWTLGRGP